MGIANQLAALAMAFRIYKLSWLFYSLLKMVSSTKNDKHEWILFGRFITSYGTSYCLENVFKVVIFPYFSPVNRVIIALLIRFIVYSSIFYIKSNTFDKTTFGFSKLKYKMNFYLLNFFKYRLSYMWRAYFKLSSLVFSKICIDLSFKYWPNSSIADFSSADSFGSARV